MNNVKFSLAAVISVVAASVYGFVSFLGFNFLWKGDVQKSILSAVAICLVLLLLVFITKKIKSARRDFKKNGLIEIITLAVYILVAMLTIMPFSHYFSVQNRKDEIKTKIETDVDKTRKMFDAYEVNANNRIAIYEGQLNTAINGQKFNNAAFIAMGFKNNDEPNIKQKERLMRVFEDDLMPDQYDSTKVTAKKWLDGAEQIATDWKPIGLMDVVKTMATESNKWLTEIKGYDQRTQKASTDPFDYTISFASIDNELTETKTPTFIALILSIVLHLLILFPYWFGPRDNRSNGLWKELFSQKENDDLGDLGRL